MSSIVFDTGPIITLTTNNLLWLLEEMKKYYKGDFIITSSVHHELIDRPLASKKFKFEALQVMKCIDDGTLKVIDDSETRVVTVHLLDLANKSFVARGNYMRIVHYAEISSLAAAIKMNSDAFIVDERTTRMIIENPERLRSLFEERLNTKIKVEEDNLAEFRKAAKNIKPIRSVELITVAFEKGLLDKFLPPPPNQKKILLESVLWGAKLNGCAVSTQEIDNILEIEDV
ncbi:MAG TPA: hypothetical protein VJI46_00490 [Candidatus Nanoarchaeia archaeon]|nr:hypothetical protein [Candidatus Nanoarchaeia archaeon]